MARSEYFEERGWWCLIVPISFEIKLCGYLLRPADKMNLLVKTFLRENTHEIWIIIANYKVSRTLQFPSKKSNNWQKLKNIYPVYAGRCCSQ